MKNLHASKDKIIGGVAAGVAETIGWDKSIVRVLWGVSAFLWGVGIVAYLICWIVFPEDTDEEV